jgi:aldehyde dehydrogenase (NAD+)
MAAAAKNMASVTMELGGKSPVWIDETADLKDAAQKIVWGKFMNGGQTCVAPDYVLVKDNVHDDFVELLRVYLKKYYGNSLEEQEANPDFARVIDERHYCRLKELLRNGLDSGAKLEAGFLPDNGDFFIPPTILTRVPWNSAIMQEEIFGPILPVLTYSDLEETITHVTSNGQPLAVYIFSKNRQTIQTLFSRTQSGSGGINEVIIQFIHPNLPFGGTGSSGFGKAHGFHGFKTFSNERSFIRGNRWNPLKLLFPPFKDWKRKIIDVLVRYF